MNLLKTIIARLNQRVEVANIFDKQFGLCELNANGNDKAWVHYIGNGQAEVVTDFDSKQGTLFWAKRGKVTVSKTDAYKMSGCKQLYITSFPLTAYAIVRKSHLPCDAEDAQDWIASRVYKLTSGTDPLFKQSIGVINYEVVPNGYANEIKTLTANYEWACVSVDMDIQVITSSEDGCYDTCATGDIPLPDLQPCTPCLTEVAVDGVTIIGDGTPEDPLSVIGAGGGAIVVEDDGTEVSTVATTLNFTGAGVTASVSSPGVVEVNIPGGGSSNVGTLQEVTDLGNTTTNEIQFGSGVGVLLNNGSRLREGTIDGNLGGAKGIAQICSVGYELKWEAGRNYIMNDGGTTIREVRYTFGFIPTSNDDINNGYVVGSRWVQDGGDVYVCTDATANAAVWEIVPNTDWNATSGSQQLANKPTIPAAQVNSDWNATSGVAEILNKPSALPPSGTAGGDLTGTYPDPTVHRIHGVDMQNGTPSTDDVWVYGGSPNKWQHQNLNASQVTNDSSVTGSKVKDALNHLDSSKQPSLGFTPENVANKSTDVATDQASNTKYPSVKAVFDWASSVFTTTAAVAAQITTALTGYATQAWVNSQGFLTAITSGQITTALGYTPVTNARTITINGNTQDLSANRTWTLSTPTIYKTTTDTAGYSSSANTAVFTQSIPANTFALGDLIRVSWRTRKTGTAGTQTLRIYVNATADLTGSPILCGVATIATTTNLMNQMQRNFAIKSNTNNTEVYATSGSAGTDFGQFASVTTAAIDWTANRFIVFAIQNSNAGDTNFGSFYLIEKL